MIMQKTGMAMDEMEDDRCWGWRRGVWRWGGGGGGDEDGGGGGDGDGDGDARP